MEYQVWTKDEYQGWQKVDCGDKEAAMREIDQALRQGQDPLLTVAVPYRVNIKLEEDKIGEPSKGKKKGTVSVEKIEKEVEVEPAESETKPGEGPGAESEGEVRPGATSPVSEQH